MRARFYLFSAVLISLSLMMTMTAPTTLADECDDCHSSSDPNPSGGYAYYEPVLSLVHDPFYPPDSDVRIRVWISYPDDYSVKDVSGSLSISGSNLELTSGGEGTGEEGADGGQGLYWDLRSSAEGECNITVEISFEVFFEHESPGSKDSGKYTETLQGTIVIADLALRASPGTVILSNVGEVGSIQLSADEDVEDISVELSSSLKGLVDISLGSTSLSSGGSAVVDLELLSLNDTTGHIFIYWKEDGELKQQKVIIRILSLEGGEKSTDIYLIIGQITGGAAFILLLIGYFTGGSGMLKKWSNRVFNTARKRIAFHCALSFEVLILSVFHFSTLIYGPYRELIWIWEVVLGEMAFLVMIIISINGIFQKRMIGWWGYQNWRRVHAWGTYLTTFLLGIHIIFNGSHFAWLRDLLGMR